MQLPQHRSNPAGLRGPAGAAAVHAAHRSASRMPHAAQRAAGSQRRKRVTGSASFLDDPIEARAPVSPSPGLINDGAAALRQAPATM